MFKRIFKILNKYYLHIIIALILILAAWTIIFYFHYNNKEQIMSETKYEYYTFTAGPKYYDKRHGFSITIPSNNYIFEGKEGTDGSKTLTLVNDGFRDTFLESISLFGEPNFFTPAEIYFSLTIVPKSFFEEKIYNETYLKDHKNKIEKASQNGFVDKKEYTIDKNTIVSFYTRTKINDALDITLSDTLFPNADVFLENGNYVYCFAMDNFTPASSKDRESVIETMKKIIESIKFDN